MRSKLTVYSYVNKLKWPSTFSGRILLTTFLGIHIPLIVIIIYLLPSGTLLGRNLPIFLYALVATGAGAAVTLWILSNLLQPIKLSTTALEKYKENNELPELPTGYNDDAGRLMANLQFNITHLDSLLSLKTKLLSILSHDARSPLNSILMAQELINENLKEDPVNVSALKEYNDIIEMGARHQMEMLNNVLTLTRFGSNDEKIDLEEVILQELLHDVNYHNKLHLESKNIDFSYHIALPEMTIRADKVKLRSVLNNLVQNAIKFTPAGGEIEINTELSDQSFKIKVRDSGTGIKPEVEPYLFDPGVEASQNGTQKEKGTGLGLWICKIFTELNGGTISYITEPGRGTTFILNFDAAQTVVRSLHL